MDTELTINERIKKISDFSFNGNTSAMARITSIKQATLRDIISGKVRPSYDTIKLIVECSALNISSEWLITGKGSMLKEMAPAESSNQLAVKEANEETRPHIPYTAAAGSLSEALDGITLMQCEQLPVVRAFPRYDFTIAIQGDSMRPKYESGDWVACRWIKDPTFLQWGRVHVLDTNQGIIIKRIYEEGEAIRCVSFNPEYPDFLVPKNEIHSICLVVGQVRL